ncbi:MAG TPA: hypothetical protein VFW38_10470 [Solirubrobacteraceae bacterium]|nr:hypothetical protein [Solirubrobacteraceae bacterium]
MLFDLRARGRRRTVQVVYFGLALLFLVGFVGFGVGVGGGGGGLLEGIFGSKEGTAGSGNAKQLATAEARVKKHPSEAAALQALVEARFRSASSGELYDEEKAQFTEKGKEVLAKVVADWNRYLALKPTSPSLTVTDDMVRVFGKEGLNEPAETVAVLQMVIPTQPPSAALYGRLAEAAYQSKNISTGDLAAQKAVSLAPASERKRVKAYMAALKKNPSGNPENETFTGTTNGTVYTAKVNPQGKATVLKTSPAPSTTAKK